MYEKYYYGIIGKSIAHDKILLGLEVIYLITFVFDKRLIFDTLHLYAQ